MIKNIKRVLDWQLGDCGSYYSHSSRFGHRERSCLLGCRRPKRPQEAADFAFRLPGRSSADTYLNLDALKLAIESSGANAVHPGYGFLSEDAKFCDMVTSLGVKFIGPSVASMNVMGNKVSAKDLMKKYDVPTVPGSDGQLNSLEELEELAEKIGFPLILKAAGGGGRGMREVRDHSQLKDAFEACSREAVSYFGNGSIFAERLIQNPRHIEVQGPLRWQA